MPSRRAIQRNNRPAKLIVKVLNAASQRGYLKFGPLFMPCALGRSGVKVLKREGDGATPCGRFLLRGVYFRPDEMLRPRTALRLRALRKTDGWCDSPFDRNYNRRVALPYEASAETLWRDDGVYDVVVVLGYNDGPRIKNRGSAIFMHLAKPGFPPTEGCIALRRDDLRRVLRAVAHKSEIVIDI